MSELSEEIFSDIEKTLDQLMQNAEAVKLASLHATTHELEALQKTQESLLARLIRRQSMLDSTRKQKALEAIRKETLEKKVAEYGINGIGFCSIFKRSARKKFLRKKIGTSKRG